MEQKGPDQSEADVFKIDSWEDYEANNSYRYIENIDLIYCNSVSVIKFRVC